MRRHYKVFAIACALIAFALFIAVHFIAHTKDRSDRIASALISYYKSDPSHLLSALQQCNQHTIYSSSNHKIIRVKDIDGALCMGAVYNEDGLYGMVVKDQIVFKVIAHAAGIPINDLSIVSDDMANKEIVRFVTDDKRMYRYQLSIRNQRMALLSITKSDVESHILERNHRILNIFDFEH